MKNVCKDNDIDRLWLGLMLVVMAGLFLALKTILLIYFLEEKVFIYPSDNALLG